MLPDTIEFYDGNNLIASIKSSFQLNRGDMINIRKETWQILKVSFYLDHANDHRQKRLRCNVMIKPVGYIKQCARASWAY